ncbi:MAG TPA: hypothetical protein VLG76_06510 [Rhabdochlamydiaceae bacterium]|nr:hypothetical protein [Rhabdochlamydiaceae bacterium]
MSAIDLALDGINGLDHILGELGISERDPSVVNNNSIFAKYRNGCLTKRAIAITQTLDGITGLNASRKQKKAFIEKIEKVRSVFNEFEKNAKDKDQPRGPFYRSVLFFFRRTSNTQLQIEEALKKLEALKENIQVEKKKGIELREQSLHILMDIRSIRKGGGNFEKIHPVDKEVTRFSSDMISDDELTLLCQICPNIKHLNLRGSSITNRGLEHLTEMPLKSLHLTWTRVTHDGLAHLEGMPLKRLYLKGLKGVSENRIAPFRFRHSHRHKDIHIHVYT